MNQTPKLIPVMMKAFFLLLALMLAGCGGPCTPGLASLIPVGTPLGSQDTTKSGASEKEAIAITKATDRKNLSYTEEFWLTLRIPTKYFWDQGSLVSRTEKEIDGRKIERVDWKWHEKIYTFYFDITNAY